MFETDPFFKDFHLKGVSLLAGLMATITAVNALASTRFVMPCYLEPFYGAALSDDDLASVEKYSATNCCGPFQNITTFDWNQMAGSNGTQKVQPFHCNAPELHFYQ